MSRISIASTLLAVAIGATLGNPVPAADAASGERSVPGTVVPSTGTTVPAKPEPQGRPKGAARAPAVKAGSLSGTPNGDCAALHRQYARSQACFAPYRLTNGGLKPEAFRHCKQVENPAIKCSSAVAN